MRSAAFYAHAIQANPYPHVLAVRLAYATVGMGSLEKQAEMAEDARCKLWPGGCSLMGKCFLLQVRRTFVLVSCSRPHDDDPRSKLRAQSKRTGIVFDPLWRDLCLRRVSRLPWMLEVAARLRKDPPGTFENVFFKNIVYFKEWNCDWLKIAKKNYWQLFVTIWRNFYQEIYIIYNMI